MNRFRNDPPVFCVESDVKHVCLSVRV